VAARTKSATRTDVLRADQATTRVAVGASMHRAGDHPGAQPVAHRLRDDRREPAQGDQLHDLARVRRPRPGRAGPARGRVALEIGQLDAVPPGQRVPSRQQRDLAFGP
jgi:hypothetical protein